jgi:hypothetical protein
MRSKSDATKHIGIVDVAQCVVTMLTLMFLKESTCE